MKKCSKLTKPAEFCGLSRYSEALRCSFSSWHMYTKKATATKPWHILFSCSLTESRYLSSYSLNNSFLFFTKLRPSRKTIMHTAGPRAAFIITISASVTPLKVTSIERCNAKMETKASANEMFSSVMSLADVLFRAFINLIVASVILVKAYAAIAIITIL